MSNNVIERLFKLQEHGTTVRTEIIAGLTTFAAMSYILVVNPGILGLSGMPVEGLITVTAIAACIGTLMMALMTNYPIALAPGMGLNAFFAFTICLGREIPWEAALGAKVTVPTLAGKINLTIPAGARSGQKMRLKGRGLPGKEPGDEFVVLQIIVPPADSDKAKKLYQQMAEEMAFNPRESLE